MPADKQMFIKTISTPKLVFHLTEGGTEDRPAEESHHLLSHRFIEIDDNTGRTDLRLQITEESHLGFTAEVVVSAVFEVEGYKDSEDGLYLMKNTAITILYPYLRNAVNQLCSLAGVKPVILPIIDTVQFFGDQTNPK